MQQALFATVMVSQTYAQQVINSKFYHFDGKKFLEYKHLE